MIERDLYNKTETQLRCQHLPSVWKPLPTFSKCLEAATNLYQVSGNCYQHSPSVWKHFLSVSRSLEQAEMS